MNYKKLLKNNHTLHLIKDDRFKTISISLRFTKPYDKEESAYLKLLERVILYNGTKKYPKLKDLSIKTESLYKSSISTKYYINSKNMIFEFLITFINPIYTEESIYKEIFELLSEIINNPIIKNNKWNEELFNIEKDNLIRSILNVKDFPDEYGKLKFDEEFFKGTLYAENNYKNIEIFRNLSNEKLYKIYKSLFNSFKIDLLAYGNYDEDVINIETEKLLKPFKQNDTTDKNLYLKLKNKKISVKKERIDSSQSSLFVGLNISDLTEDERNYKLLIYNTILGSMNNSVLFVNVREKNSLCYHIGSIINKYTDSIIIDSGISSRNYEKAKKLIEESLESMKDKKVIDALLKNAKKTLNLVYNDFYDNIVKIINYYYLSEFENIMPLEERREKALNVTSEEIVSLAKKVSISYIFLLEGSNNEEN